MLNDRRVGKIYDFQPIRIGKAGCTLWWVCIKHYRYLANMFACSDILLIIKWIFNVFGCARPVTSSGECEWNVIAGIGELRFCSHWAFKHALLLRVPLCVSWAFLVWFPWSLQKITTTSCWILQFLQSFLTTTINGWIRWQGELSRFYDHKYVGIV